ncbi:unnamed protein product [Staurois parvus]|uniref:Uncharacterized protein n=1 Tax=Staurois parvus TaxID=386267 RepID=A0ABN9AI42_9NEOB|nr:unnamed protein product [Staurois parvus]
MGPPGNRRSWGPCVLNHTQTTPKKKPMKGTRGILWGPLLTRALGQCPSFQMVSLPLVLIYII